MDRPNVVVLALGGTIAMSPGAGDGVVPTLDADSLVAAVPQLAAIARVEARSFRQLPGAHLLFDDLEELAGAIHELSAQGCRGVVVTQGTDTIEESAFALDRLLDIEMPVIVTGAMRNPSLAGADGPANLLAAVQVAISDEARSQGCLVVMNDEVHAARFVRKLHTTSPAAFGSPLAGPLGWVSEGRPRFGTRLPRIAAIPPAPTREARVGLVTIALGDDGAHIRALLELGVDGLVVAATGGGHVRPEVADILEAAAGRIPVVLASRTGAGETLERTYGFPGSEIDLLRRGLIRAGWLDGLKARILLTLLLRRAIATSDAVARAFEAWDGGTLGH
ncbi:MAG: asparaginase [Burkholderiaceae bacterium]